LDIIGIKLELKDQFEDLSIIYSIMFDNFLSMVFDLKGELFKYAETFGYFHLKNADYAVNDIKQQKEVGLTERSMNLLVLVLVVLEYLRYSRVAGFLCFFILRGL